MFFGVEDTIVTLNLWTIVLVLAIIALLVFIIRYSRR